jgi:hypothetical protein
MAVRKFVLGAALILVAFWTAVESGFASGMRQAAPPPQSLPSAPVVPPQKPRTVTPAAPATTPQDPPAQQPPAQQPPAQQPEVQQKSIEMPYKGLSYSMLAKGGVTVMVAQLNRNILEYSTVQVWISNGSNRLVRISPQVFEVRQEARQEAGGPNHATSAMINGVDDNVILNDIQEHAKSKDLGELVETYETTLFGFGNEKSLGYYQQRKHAVLSSMGGGGKLRALATASAIILPARTLKPGEVIDGTVFFRTDTHGGRISYIGAHVAGATFDFPQTPPAEEHVH